MIEKAILTLLCLIVALIGSVVLSSAGAYDEGKKDARFPKTINRFDPANKFLIVVGNLLVTLAVLTAALVP